MKSFNEHVFAVCAYKESPFLESCIHSLINQKEKCDVVVVTSTPCDYIEDIVRKYKLQYYVNTGKSGITQDWNFAYSCVSEKYKYITIAHQDDIYEPEFLTSTLALFEQSKKPLIAFTDYYEIREGKKVLKNQLLLIKRIMLSPLRVKKFWKLKWIRRRILSLGSPICCPSVTFCVKNLPEVIFKDGFRACEDWEAWEMISKLDGEFIYSPKRLMGHRIHEGSETSAIINDNKRSEEELKMFCKFWPEWFAKIIVKYYAKGQKSNQLGD